MTIDVMYLIALIPTLAAAVSVWVNVRNIRKEAIAKTQAEHEWRNTVDKKLEQVLGLVNHNGVRIEDISGDLVVVINRVGALESKVTVLENSDNIWKQLYTATSKEMNALASMVKPN